MELLNHILEYYSDFLVLYETILYINFYSVSKPYLFINIFLSSDTGVSKHIPLFYINNYSNFFRNKLNLLYDTSNKSKHLLGHLYII